MLERLLTNFTSLCSSFKLELVLGIMGVLYTVPHDTDYHVSMFSKEVCEYISGLFYEVSRLIHVVNSRVYQVTPNIKKFLSVLSESE